MAWERILVLGGCSALLAGCLASRADYGIKIEGLHDDTKERVMVSSYNSSRKADISPCGQDWHFRGSVDKETNVAKYRFHVVFHSGGQSTSWDHARFPAADGGEKEVPVKNVRTSLHCNDTGCKSYEKVIVALDRATLAHWTKSGATVRFTSTTGTESRTVTVDAEEAKRFLQQMDAVAAGEL